ncbi:cytochrome P450 [Streptomyces sp. QL37]|uniref:cytochrome P450 n=1 Tax=Streptomyces sp. QL37 TaxID=2093747 RepID=UPI000CF1F002|nr:cytochrome P450 [Streptomyces sp. QL37]PPQ60243.1 cytochrome P450 [Streptomyces sp. QL37]
MTELAPDGLWLPTERPAGCPYSPPEELAGIREKEPLSRIQYMGGHEGWLVTSHSLARAILADPRVSSRSEFLRTPVKGAPYADDPPPAPAGIITLMDPPDHTRYRRLITGEFTVRRMRQLTEQIEEITAECLDAMESQGTSADFVDAFARRIPGMVISLLLGVSAEERGTFYDMVDHMHQLTRHQGSVEDLTAAYLAIRGFMDKLLQSKRENPTDDLFSGLASTDLPDDEVTNLAITLMGAGLDTIASTIAVGTLALLRNPEQLRALREADQEGVERAVEELLRYTAVLPILTRSALEDMEIDGLLIKAGDPITISTAAANRDPDKFGLPDDLDLSRSARGHVSFGHGVHQCVAQQLARVELQVAFPALIKRFPTLRLAAEPEDIPVRDEGAFYGVWEMPVAWGEE